MSYTGSILSSLVLDARDLPQDPGSFEDQWVEWETEACGEAEESHAKGLGRPKRARLDPAHIARPLASFLKERDARYYIELNERYLHEAARKEREKFLAAKRDDGAADTSPRTPRVEKNANPSKEYLHQRRIREFGDILVALGVPLEESICQVADPVATGLLHAWSSLPTLASSRSPRWDLAPTIPLLLACPVSHLRALAARGRVQVGLGDAVLGHHPRVDEGVLYCFEYSEERPNVQPLVGTEAMLLHLVRGELAEGASSPYGYPLKLSDTEPSPIMSNIPEGTFRTVLRHELANVPIFSQPEEHVSSHFLLYEAPGEANSMFIRPIARSFVCGQVEPCVRVPQAVPPHVQEAWMLFQINRLFAESKAPGHLVPHAEFGQLVPRHWMGSGKIPRALREVAARTAEGWLPRDAGAACAAEKTRAFVRRATAELERLTVADIAGIQSHMVGSNRLLVELGVHEALLALPVPDALAVYRLLNLLMGERLREPLHDTPLENPLFWSCRNRQNSRRTNAPVSPLREGIYKQMQALRVIIRELEMTPWFQTQCYHWLFREPENVSTPFAKYTVMRVRGFGDPSYSQRMVSFLPRNMYMHSPHLAGLTDTDSEFVNDYSEVEQRRKRKRPIYDNVERVPIGGTKSDIRILKMHELGSILQKIGIPAELVQKIDRWDRTWLIRKIATDHPLGPEILRSARGNYERPSLNEGGYDAMRKRNGAFSTLRDDCASRKTLEESPHFIDFRKRASEVMANFESFVYDSTNALDTEAYLRVGTVGACEPPEDVSAVEESPEDEEVAKEVDLYNEILEEFFKQQREEDILLYGPSSSEPSGGGVELITDGTEIRKRIEDAAAIERRLRETQAFFAKIDFSGRPVLPALRRRTSVCLFPCGKEELRIEYIFPADFDVDVYCKWRLQDPTKEVAEKLDIRPSEWGG